MNIIKKFIEEAKCRVKEQLIEPYKNSDEIVEFDASEFKRYEIYNKAYPDRFRVEYDENLNRIWK